MQNVVCFFVGNLNQSGGTERVSSMIANGLAQDKNNRIIFLNLWAGNKPFFPLSGNIEVYTLYDQKVSFTKRYINVVAKLRKFIKKHHVKTFISVESLLCLYAVPAVSFLNVTHICWEHFNFTVNLGLRTRNIARQVAALCCDYVVTLTQRDQQLWRQHTWMRAKILTIANPSSFKKSQHQPQFSHKTILAVGRYSHQKGFDLLIAAWAEAHAHLPGWTLNIVGDGEERQSLSQLIEKYHISSSVQLIPNTSNIEQYYKEASFYCMSSRFEGLPMVLLEAQSYNLPIVSFDCPCGPSEVIQDGFDGLLVTEISSTALAKSIVKLASDESLHHYFVHQLTEKSDAAYQLSSIIKTWAKIIV